MNSTRYPTLGFGGQDFRLHTILIPSGRAPFGQHQESRPLHLVFRAHVPFGPHQDTELWALVPRTFVSFAFKFDTAVLSKRNFDFPSFSSAYWMPSWNASTSILYLDAAQTKPRVRRETEVLESWSLEIDYSRAPGLGADQKARGLWERDWFNSVFI